MNLGFISHASKSKFTPSQQLVILGFKLDTLRMTVSLTEEKASSLISLCEQTMSLDRIKICEVARVLGKIISSLPAAMYGPLYYRNIEQDKNSAFKRSAGNFDTYMTLKQRCQSRLTLVGK